LQIARKGNRMSENRKELGLFFSRSTQSTLVNKTGTWRFSRPVYEEKTAPCGCACPAGEDIARVEMLVSKGNFQEAWETIMMENPFPSVCGRVCFHPCEKVCNRSGFDNSVAIHHIERYLGDLAIREGFRYSRADGVQTRGEKIAIVGAGPAGLSAAAFLSRLGHSCHVFEASGEPGGLMRWGIPAYRLPKSFLKAEIDRLEPSRVRIFYDSPVSQDFLENSSAQYEALIITCGLGESIPLAIPGEELAMDGLRLLQDIAAGKPVSLSGAVAVIGGGNTAVDIARSLVRLGAKPQILYRRKRSDMPAFPEEIERLSREGVPVRELLVPIRIGKISEKLCLVLQPMKVDSACTDRRARVIPSGESPETFWADAVVMAIGARPAKNWFRPPKDLNDAIVLSHCTIVNPRFPTVFGGDLTNPVKSVSDAVASGKAAALALNCCFNSGWDHIFSRVNDCRVGEGPALSVEMYLKGGRLLRRRHIVSFSEINADYFEKTLRHAPDETELDPEQPFSETVGALSASTARNEASRCFSCGICNDCDNCRVFCPELAVCIDGVRRINLDYCKGCGICAVECPRNAISLTEEKHP
jgi:NADPH-dependent glutamate synthase beta subunit-like oxidoreductase/ferredoxin